MGWRQAPACLVRPRSVRARSVRLCSVRAHAVIRAGLAIGLALFAASASRPAWAQAYATMANAPDPRDFVQRADTQLTLLGRPMRFGGVVIPWLGLRQDGAAPPRRPTPFEVRDVLVTANALGAEVVRLPGLAATAGCPLCLEPSPGHLNPEVFAQIDLVLKTARDLGLKVILPLADAGAACDGPGATGVICAANAGGTGQGAAGTPARFFTDAAAGRAFAARVTAILSHVNQLTNVAYSNDPTILAWEDCDACGAPGDDPAVSAWAERLGQLIKAADPHHLYESGAFAGRIGPDVAQPVAAGLVAPPSVDVIGDRMAISGDAATVRRIFSRHVAAQAASGRAYILDSFGWTPALWATEADFEGWLDDMARERQMAGALAGSLDGHADGGGFLPPQAPGQPGQASLYFPGLAIPGVAMPVMEQRGRALRRFNFAMADITLAPAYLLPPMPDIVSVRHGRVVWRGAAGAGSYAVERSPDPSLPGTWTTLCDACTNDAAGFWQDPSPPAGPNWYRVMPYNINGHRAVPSAPVKSD